MLRHLSESVNSNHTKYCHVEESEANNPHNLLFCMISYGNTSLCVTVYTSSSLMVLSAISNYMFIFRNKLCDFKMSTRFTCSLQICINKCIWCVSHYFSVIHIRVDMSKEFLLDYNYGSLTSWLNQKHPTKSEYDPD